MKIAAPDLAGLQRELDEHFSEQGRHRLRGRHGELTLELPPETIVASLLALRDDPRFAFDQLIDLCGLDYSEFGMGYEGLFSKDAISDDHMKTHRVDPSRHFAVVYHLLSTTLNHRLRVRVLLPPDDEIPLCATATEVWPAASWYEREAFDLFGIVFEGHPDLRRILTDYGFIGHPFRKDFPVYGKVEMRYDPDKGRVVYQPVSIKPREVVPRIRRLDGFGSKGDGDG